MNKSIIEYRPYKTTRFLWLFLLGGLVLFFILFIWLLVIKGFALETLLCLVAFCLFVKLIELHYKADRTLFILSEEGIFCYDSKADSWVYHQWKDIKSAHYRKVYRDVILLISVKELSHDDVVRYASRSDLEKRSILGSETTLALPYMESSKEIFQHIESKLGCVSRKWYDIFAEADNT